MEAQKSFTEAMFYAPTNKKACRISKAALDRTAAGVMNNMIPVDWIAMAKARDRLTREQWRRQVPPARPLNGRDADHAR